MTDLGFGVLGPLEVWSAGQRLAVPAGRRRSVLAALLVDAGNPVPVDVLVEAAWGEHVPADPRAALHTVVSRLRSLLGDHVAGVGPAGYRIDVPPDAVDARRFERLCRAAGTVGPEQAAVLLDEALALWRGGAYAEFADRDFARVEGHRLELLRDDAREERARVALDLADAAGAVRDLEGMLAEQPFREHAVELLMTALHRSGRTSEALARYRDHRRRMVDELGLEPAPALQELEGRLLGRPAPARPTGPVTVPAWLDTSAAFLGREGELASLVEAVTGSRTVSVTGPGGVGKSRLVAEALPALADRIGAPIVVVELTEADRRGVTAAVADALGLGRARPEPTGLVHRLRDEPAILVLDNCEHLLTEVARLVDLLTRRCPDVRVVATSRRRLGLATEQVLPVEPLPAAPDAGRRHPDLLSPAAALLVDRIQRSGHDVALTARNRSRIADICRRLDGLPLALELAASRIATLGFDAVCDGLAGDLGVLDRSVDGERPLQALVDWSCELLTTEEQDLFATLSVFPGDFDLDAVASVVGGLGDADPGAVAGVLAELVDSSLVSTRDGGDGRRLRLLAIVRSRAAGRLADSGRADEVRRAYAGWVAEESARSARDCAGPGAATAFARLQRNQTDIVTALRWAVGGGDLDLAAAIAGSVAQCPHWAPPRALGDLVVEVGEQCLWRGGAGASVGTAAAGVVLAARGELGRSAEMGRSAARSASTPSESYLAHLALALASLYGGDHDESRHHWEVIAGQEDLPLALRTEGHTSLSLLARYSGDLDLAAEEARLALALADTSGSAPVRAFAAYAAGEAAAARPDRGIGQLTSAADEASAIGCDQVSQLARIALLAARVRAGQHQAACRLAPALLLDLRRADSWPQLWTALRILAEMEAALGHPHEALLMLSAADSHPSAPPPAGDDVPRYADLRDELGTRLGPRTTERIEAAAVGASREQVVDRAIALLPQPDVAASQR